MQFFHVSSVRNRSSISSYGLDWTLMNAAPGIAGSASPEVEGCFLCRDFEVEWFANAINNTGGAVDVWLVDRVNADELLPDPDGSGHYYVPARIPCDQLTLVRTVDAHQHTD